MDSSFGLGLDDQDFSEFLLDAQTDPSPMWADSFTDLFQASA
jgi:hypothetical protein